MSVVDKRKVTLRNNKQALIIVGNSNNIRDDLLLFYDFQSLQLRTSLTASTDCSDSRKGVRASLVTAATGGMACSCFTRRSSRLLPQLRTKLGKVMR